MDSKKSDQKCWKVEGKKKGEVCVIFDRCKGCGYCIEFCPVKALSFSEKTSKKGYHYPVMTGDCILCGKCEKMCPDFAIYLREDE